MIISTGIEVWRLFVLAMPIACISWTVTHEEVFKEPREYCIKCSKEKKSILLRKFFYLFSCEYCFSHYVTIAVLSLTHCSLFFDDWRGYILSGFSLVWIANVYMALFSIIRIGIKKEKTDIELLEDKIKDHDQAASDGNK